MSQMSAPTIPHFYNERMLSQKRTLIWYLLLEDPMKILQATSRPNLLSLILSLEL